MLIIFTHFHSFTALQFYSFTALHFFFFSLVASFFPSYETKILLTSDNVDHNGVYSQQIKGSALWKIQTISSPLLMRICIIF